MNNEQFNAFEEHCRSTETYKMERLNIYKTYPEDLFRPTGEMAMEDEDKYYSNAHDTNYHDIVNNYFKNGRYYDLVETKKVRVKGYDKNAKFKKKRNK